MAQPTNGSLPPRGMPILSGAPPVVESSTCRQCAKPFNPLWRRSHLCGHCGYEYCSTCLGDGQALMPRRPGQPSLSNGGGAGLLAEIKEGLGIDDKRNSGLAGYEVEGVCLRCLGMLQVTSAPVQILRSLPLKRLKDYLAAYDIPCIGPKEKEDFVQAVVRARNPATGCLPPENESYYRRKSVPKGSQSSSTTSTTATTNNNSSTPRPAQARPPPPTNASRARPPPPQQARPPPSQQARPSPQQARPTPARPAAARAPPPAPSTPRPPSPPVPTIMSLVSLPRSYLTSLSIGTLKAILYENHVRVDFKQVLEKEELCNRVYELVSDERKRLERQAAAEALENNPAPPPAPSGEADVSPGEGEAEGGVLPSAASKPAPRGPEPEIERGLCVVCQDEEATLAVVDCGHLAMCAHCSDLIMATSQECPLCRTRIVTPQRLIRIYRV